MSLFSPGGLSKHGGKGIPPWHPAVAEGWAGRRRPGDGGRKVPICARRSTGGGGDRGFFRRISSPGRRWVCGLPPRQGDRFARANRSDGRKDGGTHCAPGGPPCRLGRFMFFGKSISCQVNNRIHGGGDSHLDRIPVLGRWKAEFCPFRARQNGSFLDRKPGWTPQLGLKTALE